MTYYYVIHSRGFHTCCLQLHHAKLLSNKDDRLTLNSVAVTLSFCKLSSPKVVKNSDIIHRNGRTNFCQVSLLVAGSWVRGLGYEIEA